MIENPDLDPNNLTQPSNAFHPLYENQLEAITHEAQAAAEVVDDEQDANSTASTKVIFMLLVLRYYNVDTVSLSIFWP